MTVKETTTSAASMPWKLLVACHGHGQDLGETIWGSPCVVSLDRNSVLWDLSSVASSNFFLKSYLDACGHRFGSKQEEHAMYPSCHAA